MGRHMAGHLLSAGYRLNVFTRTKDKAAGLIERGAVWCDTPAASVADADVAITIVGNPKDVEEVYLGTERPRRGRQARRHPDRHDDVESVAGGAHRAGGGGARPRRARRPG